MNIFRLHDDPYIAAQMHCDKHVVKMILETAQMLSTAYRVLSSEKLADDVGMYKMAHKNHPSCVWIRNDVWNYYWAVSLLSALCEEYTYRYDKHHASERLLHYFQKHVPYGIEMKAQDMTFPQCMPDETRSKVILFLHTVSTTKERKLTLLSGTEVERHLHGGTMECKSSKNILQQLKNY